jgi:hypothetical protein
LKRDAGRSVPRRSETPRPFPSVCTIANHEARRRVSFPNERGFLF